MSYRVIALDLDGTLLDDQKKILPESLEVLKQARQQGVKVLIVTGRHHIAIHPFYQALELETPAICCNGTYLYDYLAKNVIESDPLTTDIANQILQRLEKSDIQHLIYVDDAMLYDNDNTIARTLSWANSLPVHQRPTLQKVENLSRAIRDYKAIWKFALMTPDIAQLNQLTEALETDLDVECEWSWQDQVDVAKKGNSKGMRLQRWVESQGLSMKDVIAFGDNFNDLSMLTTVGLGVAMGNAVDKIKSQADIVTRNHNEPGIAEVIRKYVL